MFSDTVSGFTSSNWFLYVNGSNFVEFFAPGLAGTLDYSTICASATIPLNLNDTVTVVYSATSSGNVKNVQIFGGATSV